MSNDLKKAESRLANIERVKPILAALRTISLGSWQMARNRRSGLDVYTRRLLDFLPLVLPHVVKQRGGGRLRWFTGRRQAERSAGGRWVTLVIGSERGLCGRYNKAILEHLALYMGASSGQAASGIDVQRDRSQVDLVALGSRLVRELSRAGYDLAHSESLSITALPTYDTAWRLAGGWLARYEAYEIDGVDVIYNADQGAATYAPALTHLIPPVLPQTGGGATAPVIVETDPVQLYSYLVAQWTSIALYRLLLDAALTEHAARYQLMESATQNADRLIDRLTLTVQSARRQAITTEMQELAVGAGLLETS